MKILIISRGYPWPGNGILGLFEKDQAMALKGAGHDVCFCSLDMRSIRRKRRLGYQQKSDNGLDIFEINYPIGKCPYWVLAIIEQMAIKKVYEEIEKFFGTPDVVHAHFFKIAAGVTRFFNNKKIPVVVTEHSSLITEGRLNGLDLKLCSNTYKSADALITVSKPLCQKIKKMCGCNSYVIPNVVDIRGFDVCRSKGNNFFIFVAAGNLIRRKGYDLLIEAMEVVVQQYPNTKLIICGDGEEYQNIERDINNRNLKSNVVLYGKYKRSELNHIYADADAFVLASRGETFGVVYIEAMASGLPVIATECGGPEDFVIQKVGLLIEKENVKELIEAMISLINNVQCYNQNEIRAYAKEKFSPEVIASNLTAVYTNVLNNFRKV